MDCHSVERLSSINIIILLQCGMPVVIMAEVTFGAILTGWDREQCVKKYLGQIQTYRSHSDFRSLQRI